MTLLKLKHFQMKEFRCKCGRRACQFKRPRQSDLNKKMLIGLIGIRADADRPLGLNSGLRCTGHPVERKKIAAGGTGGSHTVGLAIDIRVKSRAERDELERLAKEHGALGIGLANSFIHLDWGHPNPNIPRPAFWKYKGAW